MKALVLFFLTSLLAPVLHAQTNPVSEVKIRVSEEQDMVTITYNLARNSRTPFYQVSMDITLGGQLLKNPVGLSGDVGKQVTPGLGKRIVWDAMQDVASLEGELRVEVRTEVIDNGAASQPCTPIKTVPVFAGLGGVAVTGFGLMIGGLSQKGEGSDLYDVYQNNTNPDAQVYASLSRDEHYAEANSKHKQGSWLAVAGGVTLAAGGAMLITRLIKIQAYNRRCQRGEAAVWNEPRLRLEPVTASGPGLGLMYTF